VLNLANPEFIKLEADSLTDLKKIESESKKFGVDLLIIGGYAGKAYTLKGSWRSTKDMDFVTIKKSIPALHKILKPLGYTLNVTGFGIKGIKKINKNDIKLDIAVDKIIDSSGSGKEYPLPDDIFKKSVAMDIVESYEENKGLSVKARIAPIEDIILMKLMTERDKDHFDAIAIISDSFDKINILRLAKICKESGLNNHIKFRLETILADTKRGITKKLWKSWTEKEFRRKQETVLKDRLGMLIEGIS